MAVGIFRDGSVVHTIIASIQNERGPLEGESDGAMREISSLTLTFLNIQAEHGKAVVENLCDRGR